jgi:hypothetical protein
VQAWKLTSGNQRATALSLVAKVSVVAEKRHTRCPFKRPFPHPGNALYITASFIVCPSLAMVCGVLCWCYGQCMGWYHTLHEICTSKSLIGAEYTKVIKCPHSQKSRGLRSGDHAGQLAGPPYPIHCLPKVWFRCYLPMPTQTLMESRC